MPAALLAFSRKRSYDSMQARALLRSAHRQRSKQPRTAVRHPLSELACHAVPRCARCARSMQDLFAVRIYEEIVRFHILSEHELCEEDQSGAPLGGQQIVVLVCLPWETF